jgi:hypothetical protein
LKEVPHESVRPESDGDNSRGGASGETRLGPAVLSENVDAGGSPGLVSVYLGGRASLNWKYALAPALDGSWQATLPAGFVQPTTIQNLGDGIYLLSSRASVFSGKYEWNRKDGKLVMVEPADERMVGLEWKWDAQKLTLISEPKSTPTGSSYTGTVLTRSPAQPAGS